MEEIRKVLQRDTEQFLAQESNELVKIGEQLVSEKKKRAHNLR